MTLGEQEARAIVRRALAAVSADEVRVNLTAGRQANVRFARNSVTTTGSTDSLHIAVTAAFGRRHATATGTEADEGALRRLVGKAEAMARVAPEDPEFVSELDPQSTPDVEPAAESTARATPEQRAVGAQAAIEQAARAGLTAAGFFQHSADLVAVGNHKGLFACTRRTDAAFSTTTRTPDEAASGWGADNSRDITEVDCAGAARRAVRKAQAGQNPRPLEPTAWPVILEPQAVADLLAPWLATLDARKADEGRSFYSRPGGGNKIGERIAGENITLRTDPAQPGLLAEPFGADGLPARPHVWVQRGVLRELNYDRFWARKQGAEPTGPVGNLVLEGGQGSVDDLVRDTAQAVLVTRFWYIRFVDPQTILLTGLTRDGTFWVEGGEVRRAVRNLRFNESPIAALNRVTGMTAPVRVGRALVPALRVDSFTFSSVSDAV